mmetsp:Transcript_20488/g.61061  ORF Transcript_20488/g.61061 Transcript_20488/m.61061 type:complete len:286 (-) Transcript_20488:281-1138(-)
MGEWEGGDRALHCGCTAAGHFVDETWVAVMTTSMSFHIYIYIYTCVCVDEQVKLAGIYIHHVPCIRHMTTASCVAHMMCGAYKPFNDEHGMIYSIMHTAHSTQHPHTPCFKVSVNKHMVCCANHAWQGLGAAVHSHQVAIVLLQLLLDEGAPVAPLQEAVWAVRVVPSSRIFVCQDVVRDHLDLVRYAKCPCCCRCQGCYSGGGARGLRRRRLRAGTPACLEPAAQHPASAQPPSTLKSPQARLGRARSRLRPKLQPSAGAGVRILPLYRCATTMRLRAAAAALR